MSENGIYFFSEFYLQYIITQVNMNPEECYTA